MHGVNASAASILPTLVDLAVGLSIAAAVVTVVVISFVAIVELTDALRGLDNDERAVADSHVPLGHIQLGVAAGERGHTDDRFLGRNGGNAPDGFTASGSAAVGVDAPAPRPSERDA